MGPSAPGGHAGSGQHNQARLSPTLSARSPAPGEDSLLSRLLKMKANPTRLVLAYSIALVFGFLAFGVMVLVVSVRQGGRHLLGGIMALLSSLFLAGISGLAAIRIHRLRSLARQEE